MYHYPSSPSHKRPDFVDDEDIVLDEQEEDHGRWYHLGKSPVGRFCRRVAGVYDNVRDVGKSNTGLLLIVASQGFFSCMNVAVKILNNIDPPVTALQLIFVRMVITYICGMGYMLATGIPHPFLGPPGVRLLLLCRGFCGFFGLMGMYFSLQYLSLSDATVLTFLSPLTTAMAGAVLLGEKFGRREALAGLVSLLGVVMIARPSVLFGDNKVLSISVDAIGSGDTDGLTARDGMVSKGVTSTERLIAVGVAMLGVLGSTGAYISIRAVGKRAHPIHTMSYFSIQCIVVSGIGMIATGSPVVVPTQFNWIAMLLMIGIFGFVAQILLTMGLQREAAGRGSMAVYTQIIFASILERVFFHNIPSALSILGTLFILSSALYVALTKEGTTEDKHTRSTGRITLAQFEEVALEEGLLDDSVRPDESSGENARSDSDSVAECSEGKMRE